MSPLERFSGLAQRYLKGAQVSALRDAYLASRTRLAPVLKWVHGSFDAPALRAHLESRVGNRFDVLMVHSSVNHMLPMYTGTPLDLLRMLLDWCGPSRTLAMPAFWFGDAALGGAYETLRRRPRFDLRRTPSQMGLVTELFRRLPGALASRHPVYRVVALGPLAAALTAGHEHADVPAGRGTPFEFMAAHDTLILGVGKPMQVMTQAHHVEGLLGEAFPVPCRVGDPLPITLVDGKSEFAHTVWRRGYEGRFNMWRLRKVMSRAELMEWHFHHVPLFASRADLVTRRLVQAAQRGFTLYEP